MIWAACGGAARAARQSCTCLPHRPLSPLQGRHRVALTHTRPPPRAGARRSRRPLRRFCSALAPRPHRRCRRRLGQRHHRPQIRAIQAVAAVPRVGSGTGCSQPARWSAGRPSKASVGGGGPRYFRRSCRSTPRYRHRQTDLPGSLNGPHTTPRRVPEQARVPAAHNPRDGARLGRGRRR